MLVSNSQKTAIKICYIYFPVSQMLAKQIAKDIVKLKTAKSKTIVSFT